MGMRAIKFLPNEHFHVFNRGNSKQDIFLAKDDYLRFIQILHLSNTTASFNFRDVMKSHDTVFEIKKPDQLVKISALCLLKNHYHLLLTSQAENGISKFMLKLGTAYSMFFNTKYERTGSLFEGKFKAKHIDSDNYLKYLFSYIHLNPVSKKQQSQIDSFTEALDYPYSSLSLFVPSHEFSSPRPCLGLENIVETGLFEQYFGSNNLQSSQAMIKHELFEWLNYEDNV